MSKKEIYWKQGQLTETLSQKSRRKVVVMPWISKQADLEQEFFWTKTPW
jgi:hypothetical protein